MNIRRRPLFLPIVLSSVLLLVTAELSAMSSEVLERVSRGDPSAIRAALSEVDSRSKRLDEALVNALHEGLIARPIEVLRILGGRRHVRLVCGSAPHLTYDLAENSILERLSAVGTALIDITDPEDKKRLNSCADELDRAESRLREGNRTR
jgi:hypothetical protein